MSQAKVGAFEVTEKEISRLAPAELVELLDKLLAAESWAFGLPGRAAQGTFEITIPDGGEDFRIHWSGPPDETDFIPRRFTVFQSKAEKLTLAKIGSVPVTGKGPQAKLHVAIEEAIVRQGGYIVFSNKTNVTTPSKASKGTSATKKNSAKGTKQTSLKTTLKNAIKKLSAAATKLHVDIYGPPRIRAWVNRYPSVALWVKQLQGNAAANFGFLPFSQWEQFPEHASQFVSSATADRHMLAIEGALVQPREVVRLVGHSGLGKSRLAFEALKRGSIGKRKSLSSLVAYSRDYDPSLVAQVQGLIGTRHGGLLVVDNCPPDGHRRLSDQIRRTDSAWSLLTLDHTFVDPDNPADHKIVLEEAPREVVKDILAASGAINSSDDLDRATDFCSGFPMIAVLVANSMKDGAQHFADFKNSESVVQKLVWGHQAYDHQQWIALRTAAIFSAIGIQEPKHGQAEWVAQHLLGVSCDEFIQRLEYFEGRRIVQRLGFSLLVLPRPLAAHLASSFWRYITQNQRDGIRSETMPDELKAALCERLTDLSYLENARDVAAQLCGPQGPFGTAEALNTETGAQCLRELAMVAPEEVLLALERTLNSSPIEKLREDFGPGRRSAIRALDALIWDTATFDRAMNVMFRLALGENESWANNATGLFAQRFHIQLPGTEASLEQRARYIEDVVSTAEDSGLALAVNAIREALDTRGHSRMVDSEHQGTRKSYVDHSPGTWAEIANYTHRMLALLRAIASKSGELLSAARDALARSDFLFLVGSNTIEDFEVTIRVLSAHDQPWAEILSGLSNVLRHQLKRKDEEATRRKVEELFSRLMPETLEQKILFYVKNAMYDFSPPGEDDDQDDFSANERRATDLGKECAASFEIFARVLPALSSGETRNGLAFGRSIVASVKSYDAFVTAAVEQLLVASSPNPALLGGMIVGITTIDAAKAEKLILLVSEFPQLHKFAPFLASLALTPRLIQRLLEMIEAGQLPPTSLSVLSFGRVLHPIQPEIIRSLLSRLAKHGGVWAAIDIAAMYIYQDDERFGQLTPAINELLRERVLYTSAPVNNMSLHHMERLSKKLLSNSEYGPNFAQFLGQQIVEAASRGREQTSRAAENLVGTLLSLYPEVLVPMLADAIEGKKSVRAYRLESVLGAQYDFAGKQKGALFQVPLELLYSACRTNPKTFTPFVARIAPLFVISEKGSKTWTPIAQFLFDEFGNNKDVLDSLSANVGSGSWTGPTSQYYESFLSPLHELSGHRTISVRQWGRRLHQAYAKMAKQERRKEEEERVRGRR